MEIIKALIIDRDDNFRNMLLELVGDSDGITVEGCSETDYEGGVAPKIDSFEPDVVLLGINYIQSVEMELFNTLRKVKPSLPIIVLPPLNNEGANVALTALKKGAVEYITKTRNRTGTTHTKEHFNKRLVPVIKAVPRLNRSVLASGLDVEAAIARLERVSADLFNGEGDPMKLLVVVGCLGGVPALYLLLSSLPEKLPVPVMVVQHMPKIYTKVLAGDLARVTDLDVQEAGDGSELKAGRVYIAPGSYHAVVKSDHNQSFISLNRDRKANGYRPSMDVLLRSARNVFGKRVLVAYLSGGGKDGVEGAELIDIAGGQVILQNKSSSLLWDLPLKINIRGIDEGEYPLERMGYEITQRLNG